MKQWYALCLSFFLWISVASIEFDAVMKNICETGCDITIHIWDNVYGVLIESL